MALLGKEDSMDLLDCAKLQIHLLDDSQSWLYVRQETKYPYHSLMKLQAKCSKAFMTSIGMNMPPATLKSLFFLCSSSEYQNKTRGLDLIA